MAIAKHKHLSIYGMDAVLRPFVEDIQKLVRVIHVQVAVGSRGSVVRASAAKAGGPGFHSRRLPWFFFSFSWLILMHMVEGSVVL